MIEETGFVHALTNNRDDRQHRTGGGKELEIDNQRAGVKRYSSNSI